MLGIVLMSCVMRSDRRWGHKPCLQGTPRAVSACPVQASTGELVDGRALRVRCRPQRLELVQEQFDRRNMPLGHRYDRVDDECGESHQPETLARGPEEQFALSPARFQRRLWFPRAELHDDVQPFSPADAATLLMTSAESTLILWRASSRTPSHLVSQGLRPP